MLTVLSAAMMLEHLGFPAAGENLTAAVAQIYREGRTLTPGQGGSASTEDFCQAVAELL